MGMSHDSGFPFFNSLNKLWRSLHNKEIKNDIVTKAGNIVPHQNISCFSSFFLTLTAPHCKSPFESAVSTTALLF
jgi:hypothetical protein